MTKDSTMYKLITEEDRVVGTAAFDAYHSDLEKSKKLALEDITRRRDRWAVQPMFYSRRLRIIEGN